MPFEVPIFIETPSGKKPVAAWAHTPNAELACHPVYENAIEDGAWTITHRKTGLRINPSRVYTQEDALALIDAFEPLTDWTLIDASQPANTKLEKAVELAYEQFVAPSERPPQPPPLRAE